MSTDIENWIANALQSLGLSDRKLEETASRRVIGAARGAFVVGNPRAWWLALRITPQRWSNEETSLIELVKDGDAAGWFIPETDQESPPVFRLTAREAEAVVQECPFFEYYFMNARITCLVIENDHNEFLVCQSSEQVPTPALELQE